MVQLPKDSYAALEEMLVALDFSPKQQEECMEDFEKTLLVQTVQVVMRKLPPQEGKKIAELANTAGTEQQQKEVGEKLAEWLNEKELRSLMQKLGDKLLADFARHMYKKANDSQRTKLASLFKPEVLQG